MNILLIISIILRIIGFLTCLLFVVPVIIKQAKVKNGLRVLRYSLLAFGITMNISNLLSIIVLVEILFFHDGQIFNPLLSMINSLLVLALSVIGYVMYHFQFTDEMIEKHDKIDKLENS